MTDPSIPINVDPDGDDPRADLRWGTIAAALDDAVTRGGDREALVDGVTSWSWNDVGRQVDRAAKAYIAAGIEIGDRVAIWAPNCAEWVVALLGLQTVGAVLVPLNTRYKGAEAADIIGRSRARILVTVDGFLDNHYIAMLDGHDLPHLERIVVLRTEPGQELPASAERWEDFVDSGETDAVTDLSVAARRAQLTPDTVADLLFTSGTTGKPKGVICTNGQTLRTVATWANVVGLGEADRYLAINPFFHSFGYKAGVLAALTAGTTIYPVTTFNAGSLMQLIQDAGITVLPGAPTLFISLINDPSRADHDLSSLRFSIAGAASVPETLYVEMQEKLGFTQVAQAYGLTECVVATQSRRGEDPLHIAETTGPAVPGLEIKIMGDTEEGPVEAPTGTDGEIWIRGNLVMLGYFEEPEATAKAIDSDGWFHSGDVGRMDEHGCVKITDRIKDMFTVGGFNVYPAEVENALATHPDVIESAVVGIDDARMGQVGRAYLRLHPGATLDTDALTAFCKDRLANFKVPREFVALDEFPRNAAGKVLKTELR